MQAKQTTNKKKKDSLFKRISAWLHLWLGLASGIIVLIVSLTGAIYVFERELTGIIDPWTQVPVKMVQLPPSALIKAAQHTYPNLKPTAVSYGPAGKVAEVSAYNPATLIFDRVFVNPYDGKVLNHKTIDYKNNTGDFDFFAFILHGHRALWLPYPIGRPIIGVAILIFVVLLITGMVLWWPKKWTESTRNKSFKIKWSASFKRVNYDLHNVLGFYSMILLFIIALTGLIWSFEWVSKSIYWATSGGQSINEQTTASDTTTGKKFEMAGLDAAWMRINKTNKAEGGMYISIPTDNKALVGFTVYLREGTYYKTNVYSFDQYTFKQVKASGPYAGMYADASVADKLRRMNYDIHVGAILGIPGKIIAFIVAMISASLPVTGFYVWWGKRKKKSKHALNTHQQSPGKKAFKPKSGIRRSVTSGIMCVTC